MKVTGIDEVMTQIREEVQKVMDDVVEGFTTIGEQVVKGIVNGDTSRWNDQTGNLRSSIGYIVTSDGEIKSEGGFRRYGEAQEGPIKGRAYARSLIASYPQGIALIIVAGMEYAAYVEAMENKTVLAQGELEAARLIEELVRKLNERYSE